MNIFKSVLIAGFLLHIIGDRFDNASNWVRLDGYFLTGAYF